MHENLGELFEDYKIKCSRDVLPWPTGEKLRLLSHMRSSVQSRRDKILSELPRTGGLKMHFHVSRDPQKGWQNLPNSTFAKKIAFFSAKSIVSIPFDEVDPTREDDLVQLFDLLCELKPYLQAGFVDILDSNNDLRGAQAHRLNAKYGLVAANFTLDQLKQQFEEPRYEAKVHNLYIPYFRNVSPDQVVRIRNQEKDKYEALEKKLAWLLLDHPQIESEKRLLEILFEIDQHVADLEDKYRGIQRAKAKKDICVLIGFVGVGLTCFVPPTAMLQVLGLGTATAFKYLEDRLTSNSLYSLRQDQYYLLWKLHHREPLFRLA